MDESRDRQTPSLLVFSDDWGRHPSSCQHLIRNLLPRYGVDWVNTIGMRRPALDRLTLARGLGKMRGWLRPGPKEASSLPEPHVHSPRMWPYFTRGYDRWLNRNCLCRQLLPVVRSAPSPVVAITTIPIVADLIGRLPVARWVYYCVDDFSKWPGLDHAAIDAMEEQLTRRADVLIAVSELLQQRLAMWDRHSHLLTHGVDLEHWRDEASAGPVAELEGLERPLALFWGSIDWQMDLDFLKCLAADLPCGTIALVGPVADADPALFKIPRVVHVPQVAYQRLPRLAREAAVLVMPYRDAPGLRESQPLKLKEYLATDKPAIVRDLPANCAWADALDLARTPGEFSQLVRRRLAGGLPKEQAVARERLAAESWRQKARRFEELAIFHPAFEAIAELQNG